MNRIILTLILSGVMILAAQLLFYFVPVEIFPCIRTGPSEVTVQTLCSLASVSGGQEFTEARLTVVGKVLEVLVTWLLPVAAAILIVFRPRSQT